jgi:hypothetical protein
MTSFAITATVQNPMVARPTQFISVHRLMSYRAQPSALLAIGYRDFHLTSKQIKLNQTFSKQNIFWQEPDGPKTLAPLAHFR